MGSKKRWAIGSQTEWCCKDTLFAREFKVEYGICLLNCRK
jgi:hypothetical protein